MKSFDYSDVVRALNEMGITRGDLVFLTLRMFTVGVFRGCFSKDAVNQAYLDAVFEVIGPEGTLVVPSYSQQVGRFGVPYVHEETPTLSGVFSDFVRTRAMAVRSFHPVFSLTAIGADAEKICGNAGTNGFGVRSAYDFLFQHGGHALSLGFEYESGHIVTGAHYVECMYGVPYYYNKILKASVSKDGKHSGKVFTLNVRYNDFNIRHNFLRYVDEINNRGLLKSSPLGESILYSTSLADQLQVGYDLLSEDVYAFLEAEPEWREGVIPFEGPSESIDPDLAREMNWNGYGLKIM